MDHNTEQEIVYTVLKVLIPAIEWIDGQCGPCIRNFIDDANKELEKLNIRYRYNFVREKREGRPPTEKVEVIKV